MRIEADRDQNEVAAILAAFAEVLVPSGIGQATPSTPLTLAQAKAHIDALNEKA